MKLVMRLVQLELSRWLERYDVNNDANWVCRSVARIHTVPQSDLIWVPVSGKCVVIATFNQVTSATIFCLFEVTKKRLAER